MKPSLRNGLSAINGTAFGMNPLLQGSMMGLNGFSSDTFPFGEFGGNECAVQYDSLISRNSSE